MLGAPIGLSSQDSSGALANGGAASAGAPKPARARSSRHRAMLAGGAGSMGARSTRARARQGGGWRASSNIRRAISNPGATPGSRSPAKRALITVWGEPAPASSQRPSAIARALAKRMSS